MPNNKLTTLGYFRQRLFASRISSKILLTDFLPTDKRKWMISIFSDKRIICTCIVENNEGLFKFQDESLLLKTAYTIKTDSMNVIIKFLLDLETNQIEKQL